VIAGVLALVLALIASYLAGAALSKPLRRMARVAAKVDEGDLNPRMDLSAFGGSEIRVLADSFNHMLERLAEAFAAQRDFIADASHELRTPLTVIAGQLEVLAAQANPAPEEVKRVEQLVAGEIARISRLVDDMLLLVRSERRDFLRREEIDLEPFVSELWWAASIGDERRFELGPIPDAKLDADPDRLAQALRNLIRNAVEHTRGPDGLVRLEVQARPGGVVRFVVIDDGPGIDPQHLDRVFERFHRTDSSRSRNAGGAGLGLAIVLAIARAHGGAARAVAIFTGGARLELELPGLHDVRSAAVGGQAERRALGVTADRPSLSGVNDAAAERGDPLDSRLQIGDLEVGQREGVPGATSAGVDAHRRSIRRGLPAISLAGGTRFQRPAEQLSPEPARPFRVVGGELDQRRTGIHARHVSCPRVRCWYPGRRARRCA
jgi:signal transduction histidine kinase